MQAKDIPERPILEFIASRNGSWCFLFERERSKDSIMWAVDESTPWKVVLAKMRSLIKRKLVDGCGCGCRGDFNLTDKGRAYLASIQSFDHAPPDATQSGEGTQ